MATRVTPPAWSLRSRQESRHGQPSVIADVATFINMQKHFILLLSLFLVFTAIPLVAAPPFTDLKVKSAKRGTSVDRSGSYSTSGYTQKVRSTDRIVTIEVEYRTLRDITESYEIQCFFIGRNPDGEKFVYDAYKFQSKVKDRIFLVEAKDLYGGTKTTTVSTTTEPISGTTSWGNSITGTLTTTLITESVEDGSKCLGWIVRLYYNGEFVRLKASTHELERLAEEKADDFSEIAQSLPKLEIP
jgi:hypothetical protein